ncbi:putative LRR receptor-like serine/threonine-protein kinase FLS2-like [Capsicum annuum]|nr:putative LRR receptor-like serine/threonine-protein kinase FLS2-like [Capsicum annuum]KAF3619713.1 putative LRR receptor-like serine/threonine-protein kinase FLS2-like [Capsicum annuum]
MLNLENNSFHGGIPFGLGHLPRLVLNLRNNRLTGIIPPSVGNATKLMNFSLAGNRINGSLPKEIAFNSLSGSLLLNEGNIVSNLEFLSVSNNQISGCIPSNICQLRELQVLSISVKDITGEIPRYIGCLSELEDFIIGDNPIKGTIPASLANISTLQYVSFTRNCLEGPIPPELGKLSNLRQLSFGHNYNHIGQIPDAIFNISSLGRIAFNFNSLSGTIPATTGLHLPSLEQLILGGNQLEGEIPLFITNASKLEILEIASNYFTGTIPNNLGNLRELQYLFLHHNQLTNEPRDHELQFFNSLVDCRMLGYLKVGHNPLNGVLPNSIGNLSSSIKDLDISNARINGLIPPFIGNMSGLTELTLGGNNLMRNIPPEIGKLKLLQGLFLPNNKLNGHIPQAVCHLSNLVQLSLGDNELLGLIPACIGNLSMLQQLYLGSNRFSSKLPLSLLKMRCLLVINASQNSIEGEVPRDIGGLKDIVELYLSDNHFSGMIPSRLGELQNLQYLDLSNNSFFGQIPLSFANLISLEFLDLSLNALSGEIPGGGVFVNSTLQLFLGTKKKGKSKDVEKVPDIKTHQLISYHEIQQATNYFDESNLIGVGSSGTVYKGTLSSGIVVAIKILNLEYEEVCKRVDTESMGIEYLHHGHITPIVHCDLKPANILLDEDMVAHVGDFGISKILAVSKSMAYTETLGTLGYIAPEYGSEVIVSTNGDVYSYGIMLMEVLTKRRPTDEDICNENLDMRKWITQSFSGTMLDVVDGNLFPEEEKSLQKVKYALPQ